MQNKVKLQNLKVFYQKISLKYQKVILIKLFYNFL